MGVNKVIYYGEVLVDMSQVTVTPETLMKGETALDASGELITGELEGNSIDVCTLRIDGQAGMSFQGVFYTAVENGVLVGKYEAINYNVSSYTLHNVACGGIVSVSAPDPSYKPVGKYGLEEFTDVDFAPMRVYKVTALAGEIANMEIIFMDF